MCQVTQSPKEDELVSVFPRTLIIPEVLPDETIGRLTGDPLVAGLAFLHSKAICCCNPYATGKVQNRCSPLPGSALTPFYCSTNVQNMQEDILPVGSVPSSHRLKADGYPERRFYEGGAASFPLTSSGLRKSHMRVPVCQEMIQIADWSECQRPHA